MTGNESIGFAFRRLRKTGDSAELPQMLKIRLATGQQLMDIRLVTNIKNQTVFHCIENGLNGDGKLHRAQIGSKMPARSGHAGNQIFSDFIAQIRTLLIVQAGEIFMTVDVW